MSNLQEANLQKVRQQIDELDEGLLDLLAQRQALVEQAGRLKPKGNAQAVAAPERVAQVIAARRVAAQAKGLDADVAEAIWRAMIGAFIELETRVNAAPAPVITHITVTQVLDFKAGADGRFALPQELC